MAKENPYIVYVAELELAWQGVLWKIDLTRHYDWSGGMEVEKFLIHCAAQSAKEQMGVDYRKAFKNLRLISYHKKIGSWMTDSLEQKPNEVKQPSIVKKR